MVPTHTPWAGLAALAAMFLIPFLPDWLFDGPRTIKHHPRRHVCGECGAAWTDGHNCGGSDGPVGSELLHGELRRMDSSAALEGRPTHPSESDD
jgi:hypothetical protein